MYLSSKHIKHHEIKVRFSDADLDRITPDFEQKKKKHARLSKAAYLRVIEIVYHSLPKEVTEPVFDQIVEENSNV